MNAMIVNFLEQSKKSRGLPLEVTKEEVAKVKGSYISIRDGYPAEAQMFVLKQCCEALVEAEKKEITTPMSYMISTLGNGSNTMPVKGRK